MSDRSPIGKSKRYGNLCGTWGLSNKDPLKAMDLKEPFSN